MILFLPPLKLNLSVYSGSFAYLASGPFFLAGFRRFMMLGFDHQLGLSVL